LIVSGFTIPGVTCDSYSQSVGVALLNGTIIIFVLAILAQPRLTAAAKLFANYGSKWLQDQLLGQPIFCFSASVLSVHGNGVCVLAP